MAVKGWWFDDAPPLKATMRAAQTLAEVGEAHGHQIGAARGSAAEDLDDRVAVVGPDEAFIEKLREDDVGDRYARVEALFKSNSRPRFGRPWPSYAQTKRSSRSFEGLVWHLVGSSSSTRRWRERACL